MIALAALMAVAAPSFDCTKAGLPVERMICADATLAQSDQAVAEAYAAGRKRAPAKATEEQRAWLATRNACRDAACLLRTFDFRIWELVRDADIGTTYRGGEYDGVLNVLSLGGGWYAFSVSALYDPPGGVVFDAGAGGVFRLANGKAKRLPDSEGRNGWTIEQRGKGWRVRCLPEVTSCGGINVTLDGDYR